MGSELLNHHLISERYFFPLRGTFPDPFWIDCGDARLACSYHEVAPQARTLIHFHGNGEIVDDWLAILPDFCRTVGCNLLLAEYRGYGQSSGRPELGKILADVPIVIEALRQPPSQLIVFGRSVGSICALEAVARYPEIAGLIIESGIADVLERLLIRVSPAELGVTMSELRNAVAENLDHQVKMAAYPGPVLVLHTRHDSLVDVSHAERLYDWAGGGKDIRIFARGNHNDIMMENAREYFRSVTDFIGGLG